MSDYVRPIPSIDVASADSALRLAGGWCRFSHVEILSRGAPPRVIRAEEAPAEALRRLTGPRAAIAGLALDRPRIMGIVNVTPDSFSDGRSGEAASEAVDRALQLVRDGADILDIGGESTRPGAAEVPVAEETQRVLPVVQGLAGAGAVVSIDTRKAGVARAVLAAGAKIVNDVSAFRFDPELARVVAETGAPVILMHSLATPATMQDDPRYDDVLLDVYDALDGAVGAAEAAGIPRSRIVVDPGIGFGKTVEHNTALISRISLFHGLGCGVLLGVSRKGFIGRIAHIPQASARDPASAALGLWAVTQGIQVLRVHDVLIHRQGIALWDRISATGREETGT